VVLTPSTVGMMSHYGIDTCLESPSHRIKRRKVVTIVINAMHNDGYLAFDARGISDADKLGICQKVKERNKGSVRPHISQCREWFGQVGLILNIYCIHNVYILMVLILCRICARLWKPHPPWARPTCVALLEISSTAKRACQTLILMPSRRLGARATVIGYNPVRSVFLSVCAVV